MVEGFLKALDPNLEVHSGGTQPSPQVHPAAIQAMQEIGIDISQGRPKNVSQFLKDSFDYVITVCDDADQNCPVFTGQVKCRLHFGFTDPARVAASQAEVLAVFRTVRDQIKARFIQFYDRNLRGYPQS